MSDDHQEPTAWQGLLRDALTLIDSVQEATAAPLRWSLGGGTVLMTRINHRRSKDIDIFIDDAQLLGSFNPRINDVAQSITPEYNEGSMFIKLFLREGEIDVVAAPSLLPDPTIAGTLLGREVSLERSAEIIAKKMWHRGDRVAARDLFDLAAVYVHQPSEIDLALPFMKRHSEAFLTQLKQRRSILSMEFAAIDRLDFHHSFDDCVEIAHTILT